MPFTFMKPHPVCHVVRPTAILIPDRMEIRVLMAIIHSIAGISLILRRTEVGTRTWIRRLLVWPCLLAPWVSLMWTAARSLSMYSRIPIVLMVRWLVALVERELPAGLLHWMTKENYASDRMCPELSKQDSVPGATIFLIWINYWPFPEVGP